MKKTSYILKSLALISILLPGFLLAEGERAPVGNPSEKSEQIQDPEEMFEPKEEARAGWWNDYPPVYYPASCHWMVQVSAFGDELEIEDGSVWQIDPSDSYKSLNWRERDSLFITQNRAWFSNYTYRIVNRNNGASVDSNLKLGPLLNSEYTNFIAILDRKKGELALTNNTTWEVCPRDRKISRNWKENQTVIIGINSGWESSYDILLINVEMNNFVRAKQF